MAKLLYQGHSSIRITSDSGVVIYVDPFVGEGYDQPADIILVTHQHYDHKRIDLPSRKSDCVVIQNWDAMKNGAYQTFSVKGVTITAFPASNKNHKRKECVGYIIEVDGKKLYHAGDTSKIPEMRDLKSLSLDYAFLPVDGKFNMDAAEAAECASLIGAAVSIPFHTDPEVLFDESKIEGFTVNNRKIIRPNDEFTL
ncbi:MBL fold metallo-hydrolase [Candidatus Formimonas warabiya]|uniref:MBL fold metallo-hydrolase n=1 Tax=Formimonas warabiya TaxID=1761012 RepID=A0A3G1KUR5_FORW1|nr:MBL fold metallo-hydrolase [Candidatus Formimonas warabiya]ATW26218.1 MBL fold metallo-hydrolase [Candidatus Formimonas warabiya]